MSLVINFLTGAPRGAAPAAPDPLAKGDGHFGNLLKDLWEREGQASGFLGESAPTISKEQQGENNAVADVFNQYGLLAKGADITTSADTSIAPLASSAVARPPAAERDLATSDPEPVCPVATAGPIASNMLPPAEATVPSLPQAVSEASPLMSSRTAGIEPVAVETAPVAANRRVVAPAFTAKPSVLTVARGFSLVDANAEGLEDIQSERPQATRRDVPEGGATSDAQLTLHMTEQGATVVGRAVDSGQPGRGKLRDRIAALLSRYGMSTRDVRVNGVPLLNATDPRSEEL
jgi:hypothetical protein